MAAADSTRAEPQDGSTSERTTGRRSDLAAAAAFVLPFVAVALYALRGGSYDLVIRQELGVVVWWILLLGFVTGVLPRTRPPRVALPATFGATALIAVTAIGLTYTESDERTVNELARVLHYAGVVALVLSLAEARTWRPAAAGLAAGAVLVSLLALGSRLFPSLYPADAVDRVFPSTRLQYPLSYWNGVAAFTTMTATLVLGLSAHLRSRLAAALSLAVAPAVIAVTYLTYARGGVVAMAVGLVALLTLVPHRALLAIHAAVAATGTAAVILAIRAHPDIARGEGTDGAAVVLLTVIAAAVVAASAVLATRALGLEHRLRLPRRQARVLVAVTGALVLAFAIGFGPGLIDSALDELRGPPPSLTSADPAARLSSLGSARYEVWAAALDVHAAESLRGTGPGTFEFEWNQSRHYSEFVRDAHSFYLESLADEGWMGLIAGLVFLASLVGAAVLLRIHAKADTVDAGLLGVLTAVFVVFLAYAGYDWMWELTAVTAFALVAVSIGIASAGRLRARDLDWRARAAMALVALTAGLVQLPGLVSTAEIRTSQQEVRAGNLSAAMTDAEDAIASAPWAASPYVHRALLLERMDRLAAAKVDIERAREREPTNYRHPLLLARIEALRGDSRAALRAFRDARALAPKKEIVEGGPASIGAQPPGP